jgi:hypothetical protein
MSPVSNLHPDHPRSGRRLGFDTRNFHVIRQRRESDLPFDPFLGIRLEAAQLLLSESHRLKELSVGSDFLGRARRRRCLFVFEFHEEFLSGKE